MKNMKKIFEDAHNKGIAAGNECTPIPMIVETRKNMADDDSPIVKQELIHAGVCGFVYLTIPARTNFAKFLIENKLGKKRSHGPGVTYWIRHFGQSYEKKKAYATAFAFHLIDNGINCRMEARID
jgi:hypothetical protein